MLRLVAHALTILLALGIIVIGLRFFLAPQAAAAGYGVPVDGDGALAYLTIKGLRALPTVCWGSSCWQWPVLT